MKYFNISFNVNNLSIEFEQTIFTQNLEVKINDNSSEIVFVKSEKETMDFDFSNRGDDFKKFYNGFKLMFTIKLILEHASRKIEKDTQALEDVVFSSPVNPDLVIRTNNKLEYHNLRIKKEIVEKAYNYLFNERF